LLFALDESSRMAIPLSAVARLEDIPTNIIERAGRKDVVQYRGGIMPLLYVSDVFQSPDGPDGAAAPRTSSTPAAASLPVVVYAEPGRSFGLVVDRIVDIVDECISIQSAIHRSCVLGSAVVQGKVTEIVDVPALVRQLTSANPV
jgi:two-component system chemotaxis sensor kinase CheA